jgi:hypothetical protein
LIHSGSSPGGSLVATAWSTEDAQIARSTRRARTLWRSSCCRCPSCSILGWRLARRPRRHRRCRPPWRVAAARPPPPPRSSPGSPSRLGWCLWSSGPARHPSAPWITSRERAGRAHGFGGLRAVRMDRNAAIATCAAPARSRHGKGTAWRRFGRGSGAKSQRPPRPPWRHP